MQRSAAGWIAGIVYSLLVAMPCMADEVASASASTGGLSQANEEIRLALVVSQSNFTGNMSDLPDTLAEAAKVSETLEKAGFEIRSHSDLRADELTTAFRDFRRELDAAGENAVGFIYFTGHGIQDPDDQDNYLLAVDADIEVASDLPESGLKLQPTIDGLSRTKAKAIFFVIDACRNTPAIITGKKSGSAGLKVSVVRQDMLVAYATAAGEVAEQNVYAPILSEELARPGVSAADAFFRTQVKVAESTGNGQRPWSDNKIYTDGLCFISCEAPSSDKLVLSPEEQRDRLDWASAVKSGEFDSYKRYLSEHPEGLYAIEARAFIKLVETQAETAISEIPKTPTDPAAWPEAVQLAFERPGAAIDIVCGGTMISPNWGVTAASCFGDAEGSRKHSRIVALQFGSAFDFTYLEKRYQISDVVVHPKFTHGPENYFSDGSSLYDIALFKTASPWLGSFAYFPRSDASAPYPRPRDALRMAGFGTISEWKRPDTWTTSSGERVTAGSSVFMETQVKAGAFTNCESKFIKAANALGDNSFDPKSATLERLQFCTESTSSGAGSCVGDGGAGVWSQSGEGTRGLVGHVVFGLGCFASGVPEFHAYYPAHADWVVSVVGAEELYGLHDLSDSSKSAENEQWISDAATNNGER